MTLFYLTAILPFFFLGWFLVRRALPAESFWILGVLTGVLGLALLETTVGIAGRFWPWEQVLLWGGALALAGALYFWGLPNGGRPRFSFSRGDIFLSLIFLISTALVVKMSLRFSINDEVGMQGHQAFVETILRGNFPPPFIAFPEVPYRYHYGFTLIAAIFSRALDIPGYLGIDVLAVFLWVLLLGTTTLILKALGIPKKWLVLGLLFLVFSGGWSWFLAKGEPGGYGAGYQAPHWQLMYIRHRFIAPNLIVYFFQHPMSLGIPFWFGSLYFFDRWNRENRRLDFAISTLLLGALSLAQVMLFLTTLATYGMIFFLNFFRPAVDKRKNFIFGFMMGAWAIALAFALGGFFSFSPGLDSQPLHFSWPPGYLRNEYWGRRAPINLAGTLIYYFSSFGTMLLLWPYALYRGFRSRSPLVLFLAVNSVAGFLVPQFFQYRHTWDVIKWFLAFEISGRLLSLWAYLPLLQKGRLLTALAWAVVLFGMVTPLRYLWDFAMKDFGEYTQNERRYTLTPQPIISPAWNELLARMRGCKECFGGVWTPYATARLISSQTGYFTLPLEYISRNFGITKALQKKREQDLERLEKTPDKQLLLDLGIKWIVFSCRDLKSLPEKTNDFITQTQSQPGIWDYSHRDPKGDCFLALHLTDGYFQDPASGKILPKVPSPRHNE